MKTSNVGEGTEEMSRSHTVIRRIKWHTHSENGVMFLARLNAKSPRGRSIACLCFYPRRTNTYSQENSARIFTVTIFVKAKIKEPGFHIYNDFSFP